MISNLSASSEAFLANMRPRAAQRGERQPPGFQRQARQRGLGRSRRNRYDSPIAHRRGAQHADSGESRRSPKPTPTPPMEPSPPPPNSWIARASWRPRAPLSRSTPPDGRASPAKCSRCSSKWSPSAGPLSRDATSSAAIRTPLRPTTSISLRRTVSRASPTRPPHAAWRIPPADPSPSPKAPRKSSIRRKRPTTRIGRADNVFAALNSLRLGLLANDTAQITAASASVQLASDRLNTAQAFYGTVQNRIAGRHQLQLQL